MAKRVLLLSLVVVSATLSILPVSASAGEWVADNAAGKIFTVTKIINPVLRTANGDITTCTGTTGSGEYTSTTTGVISMDLSGCTENTFGTKCTSTGAVTAGTITITNKVFHNVIIGNAADANTPIGILITIGDVHITCAGGLLTKTLTGNVIGEWEAPNCGAAGTTYNLEFRPASAGSTTQKYEQVTTAGTLFDLITDIQGTPYTTSLEMTDQIHLSGAITPTCN